MKDARLLSVEILENILKNKVFLSEAKSAAELDTHPDSSFINMLVLTTLRKLNLINRSIKKFVKKSLPAKSSFTKYALITAAAEMLFLDTPDYAVINSYVNLIKNKQDKYLANFANAVLRNIAKEKTTLLQNPANPFFSNDFIKILSQDYSAKIIREIEEYSSFEPSLDISVKSTPSNWAEILNGNLLPNGSIRIETKGKITNLEGFKNGDWWVQDFAASLAVKSLGSIKGKRVLDLCAAPGGKTAQLINLGAHVTALDISENRLKTLQENMERLRLIPQKTISADALDFLKNYNDEKFDIILLDAPCSATGTIRRHPELVHLKTQKDVEQSAALQKELLSLASQALHTGGILQYAVCSISKIEGEKQIASFLKNSSEYKLIPIEEKEIHQYTNIDLKDLITAEGYIRTLPFHLGSQGGMDSFFIAKLQKVK